MKLLKQQQYVRKSLKRAFAELDEACSTNKELPDAHDLFKLMDSNDVNLRQVKNIKRIR